VNDRDVLGQIRRGCTPVLVLSLLGERAKYGYELCQEVAERSAGYFTFKHGTLYPILHQLVSDGLLREEWRTSDKGRPRKYYELTAAGATELDRSRQDWRGFLSHLEPILG
jgi:PadR family transcriptional regulator PadR